MSWYRTGTVAVTNGSTTVIGTATAWVSNAQPRNGILLPDGRQYEIAEIVSNTQIILGRPYLGSTASGQNYDIVPNQGLTQQLAQQLTAFIADYGAAFLNAGQGRFGDGSLAAPGMRFIADENTGFTRPGADQIGAVTNGILRWLLSNTAFQVNVPITGTAVTQSATDTTAGRLLKVGDYGLGAPSGFFTSDVDTITVNGFYRLNTGAFSTASPTPGLGAGQYLIHYNWDVNAAHQVLYTLGADRPSSFERTKNLGVWGPWRRVFNAGNILGTVSQSGGVPTGRLFETGSNANGRFLRLPDGTQFCWSGALTLSTNPSDNAMLSAPWTFPAAFSEAPNVMANLSVNSAVFSGFGSLTVSQIRQLLGAPTAQNSVSTSTCDLLICFGQLAPVGAQMTGQRAFAVGRWF